MGRGGWFAAAADANVSAAAVDEAPLGFAFGNYSLSFDMAGTTTRLLLPLRFSFLLPNVDPANAPAFMMYDPVRGAAQLRVAMRAGALPVAAYAPTRSGVGLGLGLG